MTNDEQLLFLLCEYCFWAKRYPREVQNNLREVFEEKIVLAILQCSPTELKKVAKVICRDDETIANEWSVRLWNFASNFVRQNTTYKFDD